MANPYSGLPDHAFWSRAVAGRSPDQVRPAARPGFAVAPTDRVATAGSCFAQHISRALTATISTRVMRPRKKGLAPAQSV